MIRWQPFPEIVSPRQAMESLFEDSFVTPVRMLGSPGSGVATPIDMYQTASEMIVKAALPGIKPDEVDISITGTTLTIKGETKIEENIKWEDYLHQKHRYGNFSRSVTLPRGLNTDKAEADFDNGILTLTISKSEEARPKQIKVKAKGAIESKK